MSPLFKFDGLYIQTFIERVEALTASRLMFGLFFLTYSQRDCPYGLIFGVYASNLKEIVALKFVPSYLTDVFPSSG